MKRFMQFCFAPGKACIIVVFALLSACGSDDSSTETPIPDPPLETELDGDPDLGDISGEGVFYDKFETTLDETKWEKMNRLWGQSATAAYQHGGVIEENVTTQEGYAVMKSLGDRYTGPLRGVEGRSTRLGGVMFSKERFASGRYEVKMRVLQVSDVGVLSTAWTFWYKDITEAQYPDAYAKALTHGSVPVEGVITMNQEIDIEVKGVDLKNPIFTNWIGLSEPEYDSHAVQVTPLLDNKFHIYRWDWHTGGEGIEPEVKYYIDDELIHSSKTNVPYVASNFYVGNWFAWWAGADDGSYSSPDYDSKDMLVDWVKITPFREPNDDWME